MNLTPVRGYVCLGWEPGGGLEQCSVSLSIPEDLHLIPRTHIWLLLLFVKGMVAVCVYNPDAKDRDWLTGAL